MGKRANAQAVIAVYERTGNAAQAARETGIHENTARQIIRKHLGKCVRCLEPTKPGNTMCEDCLVKDRNRMKDERKQKRQRGMCVSCELPRHAGSRLYCEPCHTKAHERNERYYKTKRKGVQNKTQKKDSLLERYGRDAVRRWDFAGGKCEACGAAYGEITIHLHHIDEDRTNNVFKNFACLCFDCHRAVHRLISSRDRVALLAWFEKTYPQHLLR